MNQPSLGLALSGGGAAGFGHIVVIEALEEMGLRPKAIAGTSAGAMIGACVAAGIPAADIRAHVLDVTSSPFSSLRAYLRGAQNWIGAVRGGIDPAVVVDIGVPKGVPGDFEDLDIPLGVVVTDFHGRRQVTLDSGPLRPALAASAAIPGIFRPIEIGGRIFVDGGVTNNLPVEVLPEVDICLAVDVASEPPTDDTEVPGTLSLISGAMRIMMHALQERHVASREGVVLVQPGACTFGALDLHKAPEILEAAEPARDEVIAKLTDAIEQLGNRTA